LKRWAIIFRARGVEVVQLRPADKIPQLEKQLPPPGRDDKQGLGIRGQLKRGFAR